eukprot:4012-Pleurochrysis_carterae.AAC.1
MRAAPRDAEVGRTARVFGFRSRHGRMRRRHSARAAGIVEQLGPTSPADRARDGPRHAGASAWDACLSGATANTADRVGADAYVGAAPRALRAARDAPAFAQFVVGGTSAWSAHAQCGSLI